MNTLIIFRDHGINWTGPNLNDMRPRPITLKDTAGLWTQYVEAQPNGDKAQGKWYKMF